MRTPRPILWLAALALGLLPRPAMSASDSVHRDVLVFIPAYEGSQLVDPTLGDKASDPACVWGSIDCYFSRTLYFALRMPNPLSPRTLLGVGPVDVYRDFVKTLTHAQEENSRFAPYTEGSDFFIFPYDWRQEIATVTAPQFGRAMESYARIHAERTGIPVGETRFIIVTHSMGGLVARTWLSENPSWAPRIKALYQVAAPNRGSVKAAETVVYGPDSLESVAHGFPGVLLNLLPTHVDQNVTKLTGITRPSLYELLPWDDPHWIDMAPSGGSRRIAPDRLLDAATWEPYWPTPDLERRLFLDDWLRKREAEGRKKIVPAEWAFCQDPGFGGLKTLLAQTASWREREGSLQHLASLLTAPGQSTRLRIIASTGLKTPSGFITWGRHDTTRTAYTYDRGNDGDGTMEEASVLDGFPASAAQVKILHGVPHGRLMIDPQFLSYFVNELSGGPLVPALPAADHRPPSL
jgi:pimeloyl-ACP methyl ester carboxylesterase